MPDKQKRRRNFKNKRKAKNKNHNKDKSNEQQGSSSSVTEEQYTKEAFQEQGEILKCLNESTDSLNTNDNLSKECENYCNTDQNDIVEKNDQNECKVSYTVESPEQINKNKQKLNNTLKSKSLDSGDTKIVDITDIKIVEYDDNTNLGIVSCNNVIISDSDSDIEWEITNDIKDSHNENLVYGTLSISTMPLTVAQCEHNQILTPEKELSLRQYLNTLNLSTQPPDTPCIDITHDPEQIEELNIRLRKKALTEEFCKQRLNLPRHLEVIDEEGSNESSITSRRDSHIRERISDYDDLEDDVFIDEKVTLITAEKYPKSKIKTRNEKRAIEQSCMLLDTKIMEQKATEARCNWSLKTVDEVTGAEVVYLTDSSSSASDIYDIGEEIDNEIETDSSVRIITPTIEVTDTDTLLKNTCLEMKETEMNNLYQIKISRDEIRNDEKLVNQHKNDENTLEKTHPLEIIVTSTENVNPSLYVLDISDKNSEIVNPTNLDAEKYIDLPELDDKKYKITEKLCDIEMKTLKSEMSNAFNNLIKEVSDSEVTNNANPTDKFCRQDSSSSVCSSQCTTKYNPTYESLNDVSNILHDDQERGYKRYEYDNTNLSHVKDVFECVTGTKESNNSNQPLALRDLCVQRIVKLPYGDQILEELAVVSEKIQNFNIIENKQLSKESVDSENTCKAMPYYPLPDVSAIQKVVLPTQRAYKTEEQVVPPPITPRKSSLRKSQDDSLWTGLPTTNEPVYVCLSPSQKMLMEKTNTIITKNDASQLIEMHKKYVDRRGYNDSSIKNGANQQLRNYKHNIEPAIPFRSQTGSRLLAIIRDPALTNNINSTIYNHHTNKSLDRLHLNYTEQEINKTSDNTKNNLKNYNEIKHSLFKPIPPPRTKKYSSSFYESDESSEFTDNSLRSSKTEKKYFHYSTGHLNDEIVDDVKSIQKLHRNFTDLRDTTTKSVSPRRPSLPKDILQQQLEYIQQKEKEVEAEIKRLESLHLKESQVKGPRPPMVTNFENTENSFNVNDYHISRKRDIALTKATKPLNYKKGLSLFSNSEEEIKRNNMYSEYVTKMAERQERKQHKVIKISAGTGKCVSKSLPSLEISDPKVNNRIEEEFISKARERWNKLGIKDPETEDEKETKEDVYAEPKVIEHKIKVIEGDETRDVGQLPNHLQDFVRFTAKNKDHGADSPGEQADGTSSHVLVLCAVIILVVAVSKYFFRMLKNNQ